MEGKKKTITFDAEGFEKQIYKEFRRYARRHGVPVGIAISRAFFLLCTEKKNKAQSDLWVKAMKNRAEKRDETFVEEAVLDTEDWEEYVGNCSETYNRRCVEEYNKKQIKKAPAFKKK